jgi:hypothetical protein
MAYLYNLYEGSLDDLSTVFTAASRPATPEDLRAAVDETWSLVDPVIATLLDWHEQDILLAQARRLAQPGPDLVERLFTSPPLGIEPYDFGFLGTLGATELATLRTLLEATVGTDAGRVERFTELMRDWRDPQSWGELHPDIPIVEGRPDWSATGLDEWDPDLPLTDENPVGLARLLLGIRPVTPGRDVVLLCG